MNILYPLLWQQWKTSLSPFQEQHKKWLFLPKTTTAAASNPDGEAWEVTPHSNPATAAPGVPPPHSFITKATTPL